MKQLGAGELPILKVLSSDFDYVIPDYQRPYAWTEENALQLLDDLMDFLARTSNEPYFLGSIVLVKTPDEPKAEVIDGQQRLTTLTILLAVLRDLATDNAVAESLDRAIREPGDFLAGTEAKPRLRLRKRDSGFFAERVQKPGGTSTLQELPDSSLRTDAQKAIRDNTVALRMRLQNESELVRKALALAISQRTYLVVVTTPDIESAHRIFMVMNSRGLDLSTADLVKSKVIGVLPDEMSEAYADKWEEAEEEVGRQAFSDLFLYLRWVLIKERAKEGLLKEYETHILPHYLPAGAAKFIDNEVVPYARALNTMLSENYVASSGAASVNRWLQRLAQIDNDDWRPPALWALKTHNQQAAWLDEFFTKLERLAASMFIRRVYATPRALRYGDLLKQLEHHGLDSSAFELSHTECADTLSTLNGDIYKTVKTRRYVLLRLDETLASGSGVSYDHKIITVEHVLPQNPAGGSEWTLHFTEEERRLWTHRLANLVLLNRERNSSASNLEFADKKDKYFKGRKGVTTFALTSQVIGTPSWTPELLEIRQADLLATLKQVWSL